MSLVLLLSCIFPMKMSGYDVGSISSLNMVSAYSCKTCLFRAPTSILANESTKVGNKNICGEACGSRVPACIAATYRSYSSLRACWIFSPTVISIAVKVAALICLSCCWSWVTDFASVRKALRKSGSAMWKLFSVASVLLFWPLPPARFRRAGSPPLPLPPLLPASTGVATAVSSMANAGPALRLLPGPFVERASIAFPSLDRAAMVRL